MAMENNFTSPLEEFIGATILEINSYTVDKTSPLMDDYLGPNLTKEFSCPNCNIFFTTDVSCTEFIQFTPFALKPFHYKKGKLMTSLQHPKCKCGNDVLLTRCFISIKGPDINMELFGVCSMCKEEFRQGHYIEKLTIRKEDDN